MKFNTSFNDYEILECKGGETPLPSAYLCGRTHYFDKKIYLNIDATKEQKKATLRHELTHVFLYETQITSQEKEVNYTEEMLCEFVGKYGEKIEKIAREYFNE